MYQILMVMAATLNPPVSSPEAQVEKVLNSFHKAASEAKFDEYFSYFGKDAVFIGTDASERWPVEAFKAYTRPYFAKGKGWTYTPKSRHVDFSPDQKVAWFDEILDSEKYGTSRGTGVLVQEAAQWKILQYHLTFPIPNELAEKMTSEIKAYETKVKSPAKGNR